MNGKIRSDIWQTIQQLAEVLGIPDLAKLGEMTTRAEDEDVDHDQGQVCGYNMFPNIEVYHYKNQNPAKGLDLDHCHVVHYDNDDEMGRENRVVP